MRGGKSGGAERSGEDDERRARRHTATRIDVVHRERDGAVARLALRKRGGHRAAGTYNIVGERRSHLRGRRVERPRLATRAHEAARDERRLIRRELPPQLDARREDVRREEGAQQLEAEWREQAAGDRFDRLELRLVGWVCWRPVRLDVRPEEARRLLGEELGCLDVHRRVRPACCLCTVDGVRRLVLGRVAGGAEKRKSVLRIIVGGGGAVGCRKEAPPDEFDVDATSSGLAGARPRRSG